MSFSQMLQMLTILPQLMEGLKKMGPEEKGRFVEQLGLQGEEQDTAIKILTAFQEGQQLSVEDQEMAQKILEKGLKMNNLDLANVMQMMSGVK